MRKPNKNANLATQKEYWYDLLAKEGFIDIEEGVDSTVAYRYSSGTPQFKPDRNLAAYGKSHDINIGVGSFFESAQEYYNQVSTLVANWPARWTKTEIFRLERKIISLHADGLSSHKIYDILLRDKLLIKGVIGSLRSVRRVVEKYRYILTLLPFDRLEAWEPGHAVEQILDSTPTINFKVRNALSRRQVKR